MEKTIYDLGLHEISQIEGEDTRVLRVSGGWLYQTRSDYGLVQTFVPFDNEFMSGNLTTKEETKNAKTKNM